MEMFERRRQTCLHECESAFGAALNMTDENSHVRVISSAMPKQIKVLLSMSNTLLGGGRCNKCECVCN